MSSVPQSENPFLREDSAVRSLNRVRVAALTGLSVEADVLGQTAYDLLSAAALQRLIAAEGRNLHLDLATPDLIRRFDACSFADETWSDAAAIARRYGRRLGYLLVLLRRGEPENRAARPMWSDAHWEFWRSIGRVYVGGGLVAGHLGPLAIEGARAVLEKAGLVDLGLELAPYGAHLPLVGLARSAPPDVTGSLLFDFGNTSVKRGHARYRNGRLDRLEVWSEVPSVLADSFAPDKPLEEIRQQWEDLADIIADGWSSLSAVEREATAVCISLACYLFDGHPSPRDRGGYGDLQRLSPHLATFVAEELARRLGQVTSTVLMHDATAAATVYAGSPRSAVLTLGTAIGNGFPPPSDSLWQLANGLTLVSAHGKSVGEDR